MGFQYGNMGGNNLDNAIKQNGAPATLDQQSPFTDTANQQRSMQPGAGMQSAQAQPPQPQQPSGPPPLPTQGNNTPSPNQVPDQSMMNWRMGGVNRPLGGPHMGTGMGGGMGMPRQMMPQDPNQPDIGLSGAAVDPSMGGMPSQGPLMMGGPPPGGQPMGQDPSALQSAIMGDSGQVPPGASDPSSQYLPALMQHLRSQNGFNR
jgi:hypothetical protein